MMESRFNKGFFPYTIVAAIQILLSVSFTHGTADVAGSQKAPEQPGSGVQGIQGVAKCNSSIDKCGANSDSAQEFNLQNETPDGGVASLETKDVLEIACGTAVKESALCKNKAEAAKAFDAAAKTLGIPSTALICYAMADEKPTKDKGPQKTAAEKEAELALKDARSTADKALYETQKKEWKKKSGLDEKSDYFSMAFESAKDFREIIAPMEKELAPTARHGNRKGYLDLVKFYFATKTYGTNEAAKQYYQGLRSGSSNEDFPEKMKIFLDCIDKAFEKKGAPKLSDAIDETPTS